MLIAAIIVPSIVIICYVLGLFILKSSNNGDYEIKTKPTKFFVRLCLFFVLFGLGFSVLSIVLIAKNGSDTDYILWIILGALFGSLGSIVFLFAVLQFEAIKGDTIYYRRFIKIKTMKIRDINTIEPHDLGFITYAKNGSPFSVYLGTEGLDILLKTIGERKDSDSDYSEQETDTNGHKNHKRTFTTLITIVICSLLFVGISSFGSFIEPIKEEKLVIVEGEFEYIRNAGRGSYGIGIKNSVIEYKITSYITDHFNDSFFDEVSTGDIIVLHVENDVRDISKKYSGRLYQDDVCAIEVNSKEYLSYDGYVAGFVRNRNWARVFFIGGSAAFAVSSITTVVMFAVYKRKKVMKESTKNI